MKIAKAATPISKVVKSILLLFCRINTKKNYKQRHKRRYYVTSESLEIFPAKKQLV
jgi:hypothetical protein